MIFTGYYEHAIDTKNRLSIPAKFRGRLDPERDGTGFVIVPGQPGNCLWVYTERYFERLADEAESGLIPDDDQLAFEQTFFPLAEQTDVDSQGRILIPERMIKRAKLGKEVIISGVRDHLEIHPRDAYEGKLDDAWERFSEVQRRARDAYRKKRRLTGPEAG